MNYKNNLKAIRIQQGLTQRQVAILLSMHCENRLSQWEAGKAIPSVENLFHLCEIYHVTAHQCYATLPVPTTPAYQSMLK